MYLTLNSTTLTIDDVTYDLSTSPDQVISYAPLVAILKDQDVIVDDASTVDALESLDPALKSAPKSITTKPAPEPSTKPTKPAEPAKPTDD